MSTATISRTEAEVIADLKQSILDDETVAELAKIEDSVLNGFTLADALRLGATQTKQAIGTWGEGESACALSTAMLGAKARGIL